MKKIYIVFLIVLIGCSSVKTIDNNQLNTIEISYDQDDEHINFNIINHRIV